MADTKEKTEHTIDAAGQSIGRVASQAARLLMGKDSPAYTRNRAPDVCVRIVNASKLNISRKKRDTKLYTRYSGYPGGLKQETLDRVIKQHGYTGVLERAVGGMLPSNKLRPHMLKHLDIVD